MKLSEQVISLELAKKLKELDVEQESYFYWYYSVYTSEDFCWKILQHDRLNMLSDIKFNNNIISAFTVSELGNIISINGTFWDSGYRGIISNDFMCRYFEGIKSEDKVHSSFAKKEADARAKMLIYLIENGLIKND